jgi:acyl-coenzyme A synthetase/AMP-(fatty) acid ligase
MVTEWKLTHLRIFASHLAALFREARINPALLAALKSVNEVVYTGLALDVTEVIWARENAISVRNGYGSTELGIVMLSVGGSGDDATLFEPSPGMAYNMILVLSGDSGGTGCKAPKGTLFELVVLPSSGRYPSPFLARGPRPAVLHGRLFLRG